MVQHSEGNDAGELSIREGHFRGIADYDADMAATQACPKRLGQSRVDFDCRQSIHPLSQQVSGETRSGPELKHPVSQLGG